MKQCNALHRGISISQCAKAQRELPAKFCTGCTWFNKRTVKKHYKKPRPNKRGIYKVRVSRKLRNLLLTESKKRGVTASVLIIRIIQDYFTNKSFQMDKQIIKVVSKAFNRGWVLGKSEADGGVISKHDLQSAIKEEIGFAINTLQPADSADKNG